MRTTLKGVPQRVVKLLNTYCKLASIWGPSATPAGYSATSKVDSSKSFMCMSMWWMPSNGKLVILT